MLILRTRIRRQARRSTKARWQQPQSCLCMSRRACGPCPWRSAPPPDHLFEILQRADSAAPRFTKQSTFTTLASPALRKYSLTSERHTSVAPVNYHDHDTRCHPLPPVPCARQGLERGCPRSTMGFTRRLQLRCKQDTTHLHLFRLFCLSAITARAMFSASYLAGRDVVRLLLKLVSSALCLCGFIKPGQ